MHRPRRWLIPAVAATALFAVVWLLQPSWLRGILAPRLVYASVPGWMIPTSRYVPDLSDPNRASAVVGMYTRVGVPEEAVPELMTMIRSSEQRNVAVFAILAMVRTIRVWHPGWARSSGFARLLVDVAVQPPDLSTQWTALGGLRGLRSVEPPVVGPEELRRLIPLTRSKDSGVRKEAMDALYGPPVRSPEQLRADILAKKRRREALHSHEPKLGGAAPLQLP